MRSFSASALGYDLNTVEFAVEDGIPYAIDFMNPAPDADLHSVGQANFDWIVKEVADMAIAKAADASAPPKELRWSAFLSGTAATAEPKKAAAKKSTAKNPPRSLQEPPPRNSTTNLGAPGLAFETWDSIPKRHNNNTACPHAPSAIHAPVCA